MQIRDRIRELRRVPATDLRPNPRNWRTHPAEQANALKGVLAEVGMADAILCRELEDGSLQIIDGHLRAETLGSSEVPVLVLDVSSEEADKLLLTLDPLSAMAGRDDEMLSQLLLEVETQSDAVKTMLEQLGQKPVADDLDNQPKTNLAQQFIAPPFSVLDARQGYWQDRRRYWEAFGINSMVGRSQVESKGPVPIGGLDKSKIRKEALETGGVSTFDPVLVELACTWYSAKGDRVLDPFAGGPVRGCVTSMLERSYLGYDVRQEQVNDNANVFSDLRVDNLVYGDAEWICDSSANINVDDNQKCHLMLSCPPYFDLEVYSRQDNDISALSSYAAFLQCYEECIGAATKAMHDDSFAFFVVGDFRDKKRGMLRQFPSDTIRTFSKHGWNLYCDCIYLFPLGTRSLVAARQFRGSRKTVMAHQHVLVFVRGDAKKATARLGEVEVLIEVETDNEN